MSPRAHLCRRVQRRLESGSLRAGLRLYSSSSSDLAKQQKYCSDLTRQHDHESYLCSLFLPRAVRPSVHAVLAYNVELAKIPDSVSELNLGRIRMQWWRDAIEAIYSVRGIANA
jgi:NADH dehydrogenase [ubiquinone] 1 alpha subcomplex assembly factor 6